MLINLLCDLQSKPFLSMYRARGNSDTSISLHPGCALCAPQYQVSLAHPYVKQSGGLLWSYFSKAVWGTGRETTPVESVRPR